MCDSTNIDLSDVDAKIANVTRHRAKPVEQEKKQKKKRKSADERPANKKLCVTSRRAFRFEPTIHGVWHGAHAKHKQLFGIYSEISCNRKRVNHNRPKQTGIGIDVTKKPAGISPSPEIPSENANRALFSLACSCVCMTFVSAPINFSAKKTLKQFMFRLSPLCSRSVDGGVEAFPAVAVVPANICIFVSFVPTITTFFRRNFH